MNRTLRRPMFRTGGSAEGITSGLDVPKLNASRQGYEFGKTVENIKRDMPALRKLYEENMATRGSDFNDFLINLGLDLVSRPRSGNIFQQVATSAKGPFAQFQASKAATRKSDDALSQALIGDLLDRETTLEEARIKAKGDQDDFMFERQQAAYTKLIGEQRKLEKQLEEAKEIPTGVPPAVGGLPSQSKIESIKKQLEDNAKLQALYTGAEDDPTRKALLQAIGAGQYSFEDLIVYDQTGKLPVDDEPLAKGGRVGLQMGGQPMPAAMPTDQGPVEASPVQSLTFEELRSRLPNTITDDIVTLIANSEQALADFANIQTQQDVNAFNQKYEVNLQLPAEA
jgi:hypothetical protein